MLKLVYIFENSCKRRYYQIAIFLFSQAFMFLPFDYESFNYLHFFHLHPFLMFKFSPYYVLHRVRFASRRHSIESPINYQSVIFGILYLTFVILSSNVCVVWDSHFSYKSEEIEHILSCKKRMIQILM